MTRLDIYFDFLLILLSEKPSALFDFTNPDWAPTLNLGHAKVVETDLTRYQRLVDRKERDRTRFAAASLTAGLRR